jgi:hypothetical protein
VSIAFDATHKTGRQWQSLRRKALHTTRQPKGLSGAALEAAVMAIAAADSSLVKVQAGAS